MMLDRDPLVREFSQRWESTGGACFTAEGRGAIQEVVTRVVHDLAAPAPGPSTVVYWKSLEDLIDWTPSVWTSHALACVPWEGTRRMREVVAQAAVGVTGSSFAVSSTGSVALWSSPDTGLLPSVLTPAHLVLIARETLVSTIREGLARVDRQDVPPLIKLITGPSMTADIEGTLVRGVHGPGKVSAVIYQV